MSKDFLHQFGLPLKYWCSLQEWSVDLTTLISITPALFFSALQPNPHNITFFIQYWEAAVFISYNSFFVLPLMLNPSHSKSLHKSFFNFFLSFVSSSYQWSFWLIEVALYGPSFSYWNNIFANLQLIILVSVDQGSHPDLWKAKLDRCFGWPTVQFPSW